jgi:hypothetical protein
MTNIASVVKIEKDKSPFATKKMVAVKAIL